MPYVNEGVWGRGFGRRLTLGAFREFLAYCYKNSKGAWRLPLKGPLLLYSDGG